MASETSSNVPLSTEMLSSKRLKLFELMLKKKNIRVPQAQETQVILPRTEEGPQPLSFAQQRIWFLDQFDPGTPAYNIPLVAQLKGQLNVAALQHSLNEVIRRHEILRTTFSSPKGEPRQIIAPALTLILPVVDLQELPEQSRVVERLAIEDARRSFDLAQGPLLRATLLKLNEGEHSLLLTMHHIISDGWSMGVFVREMASLYKSFSEGKSPLLPPLAIQYADFARWQQQWMQGDVLEAQVSFWKKQLSDAPPALELPTDRPRPSIQTSRGANLLFTLSKSLSEALNSLSRSENVSLFMTLLAAFKVLLHRYTQQNHIVVGSPIANRNRAEVEDLIGFFVNTLVLHTDLSGNPSFRELLGRVRKVTLEAYDHQDLPFEKLVEVLQLERDLSYTPLFQVMFSLQNTPLRAVELPDLKLSFLEPDNKLAQFDLTLSMAEGVNGLAGSLNYNTDLFDRSTIEHMLAHFKVMLKGIVANPEQRLCDLPLLTEAEQNRLLVVWNDTWTDYPKDSCVHELFEDQGTQTPNSIAAIFKGQELTYHELNHRANQLAHYLQTQGVGPETLVGICMRRSLEMIVGILAILKAGAAYVPLDPSYPRERLAFILRDSQVPVLLSQEQFVAELPIQYSNTSMEPSHGKIQNPKVICLDTSWGAAASKHETNPVKQVSGQNLACVIYTSGSTGQPKGVLLQHRSIVNLIISFIQSYNPVVTDRILPLTSFASASFVGEIFPILCVGGALVLPDEDELLGFEEQISLISDYKVSIISTVPALMARLNAQKDDLPALRLILCGGEALLAGDVDKLLGSTTVVNGYGLTETTVCSTFFDLSLHNFSESGSVPIGAPIINHQTYILDEYLNPLPAGCLGELYIAGEGLARGYLDSPELTAAKFVPNPFQPGERMYRTGDLGRWLPNGIIEFLGRVDHQVKIRGFRVELKGIEATLSQHPCIQEAVVVAREDTPGEKRLVAYFVPNEAESPTASELRSWLQDRLPDYMIPSAFEALTALPLTPNGKVNVKALPFPQNLRPELARTYVAPQTEVERAIVAIWQEVLHVEVVGVHDNFFDLGGHSLLMAQVHSQLRDMFKPDLSMVDMFRYPTISALAKYLSQEQREQPLAQNIQVRTKKRRQAVKQQQQLAQARRAKSEQLQRA